MNIYRFFISSVFTLILVFISQVQALPIPPEELQALYKRYSMQMVFQGYLDGELQKALHEVQTLEAQGASLAPDVKVGSLGIEAYLASRSSGYSFRGPAAAEAGLIEIIEKTQIERRLDPNEKELILGDAYHWLGHIYEDRGDLAKAFESHFRAFFHYSMTELQHSPRINSRVEVHEHAVFHLERIKTTLVQFTSGMVYYRDVVMPRQALWETQVVCAAFFH